MQGNSYCSLKAPSEFLFFFSLTLRFQKSGNLKQQLMEFQGLTRNAEERQVIEKEREGMQRNSYCSLKAPSPFVSPVEFSSLAPLT
jgi:hypothetical protein